MDDRIMYAWQVVGDYLDNVFFTCARQETAEYLRDMLEAHEENMWREIAKSCNMRYDKRQPVEQKFSIQECEVIL